MEFEGAWQSTAVSQDVVSGHMKLLVGEDETRLTMTYTGSYLFGESLDLKIPTRRLDSGRLCFEEKRLTLKFEFGSDDCLHIAYDLTEQIAADLHGDIGTATLKCTSVEPIFTEWYYRNWHGHTWLDLCRVYRHLRLVQGIDQIVYLAGDSSLDNKHWLLQQPRVHACKSYADIMSRPQDAVPDVSYWINKILEDKKSKTACLMTSVEATTLGERLSMESGLRMQDRFIRDHVMAQDTIIVSIGGNDIALAPTARTMFHLAVLMLAPRFLWRYNPSFRYFVRMFKDGIRAYLEKLTERELPSKIAVCMIYFPCEVPDPNSWSRQLLRLSGYDRNPAHLQAILRQLYVEATQQIQLNPRNGRTCEIVPVPLFDILDASNPVHYVQRVEPSKEGGRLMADYFVKHVL